MMNYAAQFTALAWILLKASACCIPLSIAIYIQLSARCVC